MKKFATAAVGAAAALALAAGPAVAAPGNGNTLADKPDTACMQAGIAAVKGLDAFSSVAKDGLPISLALALDVTVRPGADISGVPDPIPLNVVLADHRAGDDSLFVYPWC